MELPQRALPLCSETSASVYQPARSLPGLFSILPCTRTRSYAPPQHSITHPSAWRCKVNVELVAWFSGPHCIPTTSPSHTGSMEMALTSTTLDALRPTSRRVLWVLVAPLPTSIFLKDSRLRR